MRYIIYILICWLVFTQCDVSFAGDYIPYKDIQNQIRKYKEELQRIENILNNNNLQIDSYKKELKNLVKQLNQIAEIIKNSENKNLDSGDKMILLETELSNQIAKLETLRNTFKNKIIWLYKNGSDYPTQILFTSGNITQFYTRLQYLQKISQMRLKDYEKIIMESYILEEKKRLSKMNEPERRKYFSEKKETQKNILFAKKQTENLIDSLNYLNEIFQREIRRLNSLIKETENFSSAVSSDLRFSVYSKPDYGEKEIEELKGNLILPVSSIYILIDFGKTVNPRTRVFTYNNGIDFLISEGSDVFAVYDGTVHKILALPEFGNTVIIKHDDNYFSIYSVLGRINVSENQEVRSGQLIGNTSMNLNGQCFHFEFRENFIPVDPKLWLKWN
ncbi:MAG: peptidoglycan DD-metalloendopeptidase family protein [Ignavibacteria bacterium]|nr:peptidoglycan DD-metalloendopeptidase family protein [Ignavibacteria bacterium]